MRVRRRTVAYVGLVAIEEREMMKLPPEFHDEARREYAGPINQTR